MRQPLSTMTKIAKAFTQCVTRTKSGWIVLGFRRRQPCRFLLFAPTYGLLAKTKASCRVDRPVAFAHDGEAFITREYGGLCASS